MKKIDCYVYHYRSLFHDRHMDCFPLHIFAVAMTKYLSSREKICLGFMNIVVWFIYMDCFPLHIFAVAMTKYLSSRGLQGRSDPCYLYSVFPCFYFYWPFCWVYGRHRSWNSGIWGMSPTFSKIFCLNSLNPVSIPDNCKLLISSS